MKPLYRRACQLLVADPARDASAALKGAGWRGTPKGLNYAACMMLKKPEVKAYLAELTTKALATVQGEERKAIADQAEVLRYLTTVLRARLGDYLDDDGNVDLVKVREAPAGLFRDFHRYEQTVPQKDGEPIVIVRTRVGVESALTAAARLLDHYDGVPAGGGGTTKQAFLDALNEAVGAEGMRELLAVMRARRAIDVTAEVVG